MGALLGGRYRLGPVIGQGGMAVVHSAEDTRLGRRVAVKLLRPELARKREVRRRFEEEARSAARLSHPNIVTVFDWGEEETQPYLVMECVDGPTLADEMRGRPLPLPRVREMAQQVLSALDAAHRNGLIHRDVKPANIVLGADGRWMVADFGIAKSTESTTIDLTTHGMVVGTVAYMAPERLRGEPATVGSDLYAVGVILDEALAGRVDDPPLTGAARRAMERDPRERFGSAAEMAAAIASAPTVAMRPIEAAPQTVAMRPVPAATATTAVKPQSRVVLVATLVVVAVMVVTAAVGIALAVRDRSSTPDPPSNTAPLPQPLERSVDELDRVVEP